MGNNFIVTTQEEILNGRFYMFPLLEASEPNLSKEGLLALYPGCNYHHPKYNISNIKIPHHIIINHDGDEHTYYLTKEYGWCRNIYKRQSLTADYPTLLRLGVLLGALLLDKKGVLPSQIMSSAHKIIRHLVDEEMTSQAMADDGEIILRILNGGINTQNCPRCGGDKAAAISKPAIENEFPKSFSNPEGIEVLGLSKRTYNIFKRAGINTMTQLAQLSHSEIEQMYGLGQGYKELLGQLEILERKKMFERASEFDKEPV